MKNFAIRTFVLVLAVAGFSASSIYSASAARTTSQPTVVLANGGSPTPLCNPNHGTFCHID